MLEGYLHLKSLNKKGILDPKIFFDEKTYK